MTKFKGLAPPEAFGIVGSVAYIVAVYLSTQKAKAEMLPAIVMTLTIASAFLYYFIKGSNPLANLSAMVFGLVYITIPLGCIVSINYFFPLEGFQDGRWWLLYLLVVTKMTDTGAFFFGRTLGRTKLSPKISPKKTWEGAIGGSLTAIICGVSLCLLARTLFFPSPIHLGLKWSILLSFLISITAQFGDLAESLLKRDANIKDSNQLPGLGGVLDMIDSLVFTAPMLYIFLKLKFA
jgi:phosphatidate cytidylyltransferase